MRKKKKIHLEIISINKKVKKQDLLQLQVKTKTNRAALNFWHL